MIFVDTSAWFAACVPTDRNYEAADEFIVRANSDLLVTTDYVLDETLTLLKVRGEFERAREFGRRAIAEQICRLVWIQKEDALNAWKTFESFQDKGWSFTDCVSRAIMERLNIRKAFAFDEHFRQFGDIELFP